MARGHPRDLVHDGSMCDLVPGGMLMDDDKYREEWRTQILEQISNSLRSIEIHLSRISREMETRGPDE